MRVLTTLAVAVAMSGPSFQAPGRATVVLDHARVRAWRTTAGVRAGVDRGAGVVIALDAPQAGEGRRAVWADDVAVPAAGEPDGDVVILQPLARATGAAGPPPAASTPGEAPFTGMSFAPLFDNARVSVIRARMEVGAREGEHTHGSDTIVVHLSGGEIEDTAQGRTVRNRWQRGDVEFEARGSSHSARNMSHPVDVVLVVLKP